MIYYLMYEDIKVLRYDLEFDNAEVLSVFNLPYSFDLDNDVVISFKKFCIARALHFNREFCKELLLACGLDNQDSLSICLATKGLSFRDNYWIKREGSDDTWSSVNLYENEFSVDIADVGLTGSLLMPDADKIFTGELTVKGTRAKGIFRVNGKILLYKKESIQEILAEVLSKNIANAIGVKCATYWTEKYKGVPCSVCELGTSLERELIPCRDVMLHKHENSYGVNSETHKMFMRKDCNNFIKMQIFDYLTLNVDRNRDNFGFAAYKGKIAGLFPLFDHDSCFKGKSDGAKYFVTDMTFAESMGYLKACSGYGKAISDIDFDALKSEDILKYLRYFGDDCVPEYLARVKSLIN